MRQRTRDVMVGITMLVGLGSLGLMLMLFGYGRTLLEPNYTVRVQVSEAGGLGEGSRVLMAGIGIGKVTEVTLLEPATRGVVVEAAIRGDVGIPAAAEARLSGSGVFGGSSNLVFDVSGLSDADAQEMLAQDGSAQIRAAAADGMIDQLGRIMAQPIADFHTVTQRFETLSGQWETLGANLVGLTEAREVSDVDAGEVSANIASLLGRLDQQLAAIDGVIRSVDSWVSDEQLRSDVKQAAANARELTAGAADAVETMTERLVKVADSLAVAMDEVGQLTRAARAGEGTLGRMVGDAQLYENLNDAAARLDVVLQEAQLLIEKWKAEGLPVQF